MREAGSRSPGVRSWFSGGRATTRVAPTRHIPAPRAGWKPPSFPGSAAILAAWRSSSPPSWSAPPPLLRHPAPAKSFLSSPWRDDAYCGVSLPEPGRRSPPRAARPHASWERGHLGRVAGWQPALLERHLAPAGNFFPRWGKNSDTPSNFTRVNRPGVCYGVSSFRFFTYETPPSPPSYRPEQPSGSTQLGPHKPFPERPAS